ncbi:hypothetical protein QBC34DRAFT_208811 [Podospora aff. communis PSN243]|uniref:Uncharacterized protein n=1 Tax=Podospora aff. communis PSN243 TaxID=3040156 RepID=A0AAV9H1H7_9PEZI|nr:hypothetical protein QBC34DRAFT_208811 [Podospora aff. communis PSN243]
MLKRDSSKNGSITAFFKPVPKPGSQQTLTHSSQPSQAHSRVRTPSPASAARPTASSHRELPSSPPDVFSPPPLPAPTVVLDRDTIIKGSDEEDDYTTSDDDLLLPPIGSRPSASTVVPMPPARRDPVCVTPRAKRTALEFHSSPLTIMPKHRFDFKALMKHAAADNALEASKQRIESMQAAEEAEAAAAASASLVSDGLKPRSLHDTMLNVLSSAENSQDEGRHKQLLRAVKRTETTEHRKCWHFFDPQPQVGSPSIKARPIFPKPKATGIWSFLASDEGRSELFEDGIPYSVQLKTNSLPDAIFVWVLGDLLAEGSRKLREGYFRLLSVCEDQVQRNIDADFIDGLFKTAGAAEWVFQAHSQASEVETGQGGSYSRKDCTNLRSVLQVLIDTSQFLRPEARERSVVILLRLGMDNIIREDQAVARDYQDAMDWLVAAVKDKDWDTFCGNVCSSLYNYTKEVTLRCDAASAIPLLRPKVVDLRRRLALVCIFEDPQKGYTPPETTVTIKSIIQRLHEPIFLIDRQRDDFLDMVALAELLGYAIGDGCPTPSGTEKFNQEVDQLAWTVRTLCSKIETTGHSSSARFDARSILQALEKKLQYATRTQPRAPENIFGIGTGESRNTEVDLSRQQRFMERFVAKRGNATEAVV